MIPQQLVAGMGMGLIYGLVAIGYSMVFRATRVLNFALGEFLMAGGLVGYSLLRLGLPYPVAFLAAVAAVTAGSSLLERAIFLPLRRRGSPLMNVIIATIGLSIFLQNFGLSLWGADPLTYPGQGESLVIGTVRISPGYLYIFGLALLLLAGLQFFFTRTRMGTAIRASAQDPYAARLMGIDVDATVNVTFAVAAGFCAAAGVLMSPLFYASYDMGVVGFKGFASAVLGGLGHTGGAMVGGLLVGLAEVAVVNTLSSDYRDAIIYGLLVATLMFLPTGLLKARDASV